MPRKRRRYGATVAVAGLAGLVANPKSGRDSSTARFPLPGRAVAGASQPHALSIPDCFASGGLWIRWWGRWGCIRCRPRCRWRWHRRPGRKRGRWHRSGGHLERWNGGGGRLGDGRYWWDGGVQGRRRFLHDVRRVLQWSVRQRPVLRRLQGGQRTVRRGGRMLLGRVQAGFLREVWRCGGELCFRSRVLCWLRLWDERKLLCGRESGVR